MLESIRCMHGSPVNEHKLYKTHSNLAFYTEYGGVQILRNAFNERGQNVSFPLSKRLEL